MGGKTLPGDDDRLNELSDEELICYANGNRHVWQHTGDYVEEKNAQGKLIVMRREWRCTVCPRQRAVFVNCIQYSRGNYQYWTEGRSGPLIVGERPGSDTLLRTALLRTSTLRTMLQ